MQNVLQTKIGDDTIADKLKDNGSVTLSVNNTSIIIYYLGNHYMSEETNDDNVLFSFYDKDGKQSSYGKFPSSLVCKKDLSNLDNQEFLLFLHNLSRCMNVYQVKRKLDVINTLTSDGDFALAYHDSDKVSMKLMKKLDDVIDMLELLKIKGELFRLKVQQSSQ